MGKSLISGMANVPEAKLVAVTDVSAEAAEACGKEYKFEWHTDHRELLGRSDVDAVIIAVPNKFHAPVTMDAAKAGKHVFCEKPMAMNAGECRDMIRACKEAGVKLQIGQVLRYIPDFAHSLAMVRSGELGEVFYGFIARYGAPAGLTGKWRSDPSIVGGWLHEVGVHEIDYARCVFGKPVAVTAWMIDRFPEATVKPDLNELIVEFEGGRVCHLIEGAFSALGRSEVELAGTKGAVKFRWGAEFICKKSGEEKETLLPRDRIGPGLEPAVQREVHEWITCILEDSPPTIPGEDGLANIEIVDAAYRSAREGRPISLLG
jgi:myo-inositol 2-dehydrogenase/D-chiro-inositol 1-dehydrogenase/scyllo-inositol 2-dehydrogenase (NAD+)